MSDLLSKFGAEAAVKIAATLAVASSGLILNWLRITWKFYRLKKEYPIAGSYITKYEDVIDGKKVWVDAKVDLIQKGINVNGKTTNGKKAWEIEGRIDKWGYFYGSYGSENPNDPGRGNFFLEREDKVDWKGLWSGYAPGRQEIVAGHYIFRKCEDLRIRDLTQRNISAAIKLAEDQLGDRYININEFKDVFKNQNAFCLEATRKHDRKVVGILLSKIQTSDSFLSGFSPDLKGRQHIEAVDKIGVIRHVAVISDSFDRGVEVKLLEESISRLPRNVHRLAMTAWRSDKAVHIESLAKQFKFEAIDEIPDFWKKSSLKKGHRCPSCGEPPCRCAAILYTRSV